MNNMFEMKFIKFTEQSLKDIGFDLSYTNKAKEKHIFKTIKIYNLSCAQANILKQTAISCGTDCAVHREVITGKIEKSDCIISATINQFYKIAEKLKHQPLKLSLLAQEMEKALTLKLNIREYNGKKLDFQNNQYLMGILNVTPDSFSDGGKYLSTDNAIKHYKEMKDDGAGIIDIGAESTRPYSTPTDIEEEIKRLMPVITAIRKVDNKTILSIDTRNSKTAQMALEIGAHIINDVSSFEWDNNMIKVIQQYNCPVVLNHSYGRPEDMQNNIKDIDVVDDIYNYFKEKIDYLESNGIDTTKIIIDPGIGFGKSREQNYQIISRIDELKTLQRPILVGHSRKSFIKETIMSEDISELDTATSMISEILMKKGINILRVHNVKIHNDLKKITKSLF